MDVKFCDFFGNDPNRLLKEGFLEGSVISFEMEERRF
jgi:hypothetical protein